MKLFITKLYRLMALTVAVLAIGVISASASVDIPRESLNYRVMFKWGLINKKAGWARLTYRPLGATAHAVLYAGSEPWADKIYCLRDTLYSTIRTSSMTPTFYERVANEDNKYSRDIVRFSHSGHNVTATADRYRRAKPGAELKHATATLSAVGVTVDMLSAFYYVRNMPFATMQPMQQRVINIFSAKKKERLTITYVGREKVKIDNRTFDTYHIKFRFTTEGSKKSSDDIDTWLETDSPHRPVKLEGKLKIGKILCLLDE